MNLRKRSKNGSSSSLNYSEVLIDESSSKELEVEKILGKRRRGCKVQFLLLWKGYPESEATWENKSFLNCPILIKEFEDNLRKEKEDSKRKKESKHLKEKSVNGIKNDVKRYLLRSPKTTSYNEYSNTSLEDFVVTNASKQKHRIKNVKSHKKETIKKKQDVPGKKHANKNVESDESSIIGKRQVSGKKHATKIIESDESEMTEKRHYVPAKKHAIRSVKSDENEIIDKREVRKRRCAIENDESDESVITKKRQNASIKKHALRDTKNVESDEYIVPNKGQYVFGCKWAVKDKSVGLKKNETVGRNNYDDLIVKPGVKNLESERHKINKETHDGARTRHTMKNVESDIVKKRPDGLNQKKHEAVRSSLDKLSKTYVISTGSNKRKKEIPKFPELVYYVKSTKFPKERKNNMCSAMRVSFQGSDVLKGFNQLVEAGIAAAPLPNFLCKPLKTGKTETHISIDKYL